MATASPFKKKRFLFKMHKMAIAPPLKRKEGPHQDEQNGDSFPLKKKKNKRVLFKMDKLAIAPPSKKKGLFKMNNVAIASPF